MPEAFYSLDLHILVGLSFFFGQKFVKEALPLRFFFDFDLNALILSFELPLAHLGFHRSLQRRLLLNLKLLL